MRDNHARDNRLTVQIGLLGAMCRSGDNNPMGVVMTFAVAGRGQNPEILNRKQAANFLTDLGYPICAKTLRKLNSNNNEKGGPPFYKTGWKTLFYKKEDLMAWASVRIRRVE
jgi:hypothetical protein